MEGASSVPSLLGPYAGLQNQHFSTIPLSKQHPQSTFPNIPLPKPNPHNQTMPFAFPFIPRPLPFTIRRFLVLLRRLSFGFYPNQRRGSSLPLQLGYQLR
jgi:hypothetical protein